MGGIQLPGSIIVPTPGILTDKQLICDTVLTSSMTEKINKSGIQPAAKNEATDLHENYNGKIIQTVP